MLSQLSRGCTTLVAGALVGGMLATTPVIAKERLVRLDAVLAQGGEPVYDAVKLDVWQLKNGQPVARMAERHAAPAEVELDPGRYRVEAVYGNARRVTDITVPATGDTRTVINLRAGRVSLNALPNIDGAPIPHAVSWEIRRYRRGSAPGRKVADTADEHPAFWLSEGWYEVVVKHRDRSARHVVEVAAGQNFDYAIVLAE